MKDIGPIKFCVKCEHMKIEARRGGHFIVCGVDQLLAQMHANTRNCPMGYFKAGIGDLLKRLLVHSGIDKLYRAWAKRPCGCDKRRRELNSRWDEFFHWMEGWTWKRLMYCPCENS